MSHLAGDDVLIDRTGAIITISLDDQEQCLQPVKRLPDPLLGKTAIFTYFIEGAPFSSGNNMIDCPVQLFGFHAADILV